ATNSTWKARTMPMRRSTEPACSIAPTGRSGALRSASSPGSAAPPPPSAARRAGEHPFQVPSSHATAYAKGTEPIADVLVAAGAVDLVLGLEEQAVLAATRADANRLPNPAHAHPVRA